MLVWASPNVDTWFLHQPTFYWCNRSASEFPHEPSIILHSLHVQILLDTYTNPPLDSNKTISTHSSSISSYLERPLHTPWSTKIPSIFSTSDKRGDTCQLTLTQISSKQPTSRSISTLPLDCSVTRAALWHLFGWGSPLFLVEWSYTQETCQPPHRRCTCRH